MISLANKKHRRSKIFRGAPPISVVAKFKVYSDISLERIRLSFASSAQLFLHANAFAQDWARRLAQNV